MNKNIVLTEPGGFPFTQDTLAFLQSSYKEALGAIASVFGQYVILKGTQSTGGWVCVNGEIMPFPAGSGNNCTIATTEQQALFADGVDKDVYFTKTLVFSLGTPLLSWANFVQLSTIANLQSNVNAQLQQLTDLITNFNNHTTAVNPHNISKNTVGLGNLPNAKNDNPLLNDSNVLATTKATYNIIRLIDTVHIGDVGAIAAGARISNVVNSGADSKFKVLFPATLTTMPRAVIPVLKAQDNSSWNDNNDVCITLLSFDLDGFTIATRETSSHTQDLSITYILL